MRPHTQSYPHPKSAPTGNGKYGFYTYRGKEPWTPKGSK